MNLRRILAGGTATIFAATALVACSSDADSGSESTDGPIRIGTTDAGKKAWTVFEEQADAAGVDIEVVPFSDYTTPNQALSQDQIDVNLFQHLLFLAGYNVGNNDDLTPVGASEIVPLALFWKDKESLDGIEGQSVAVPNDPSNLGRAINVLVQADLITLKTPGLISPTELDVDEAASKVTLTPVDAAQTTVAYGEGTPAIINNSFLDRAGIDPNTAVFEDDPESQEAEPYINVFVTKAEDAEDPRVAELIELWHSPEVQAAVEEDSAGTSIPVKRTAAELQEILDRLEADSQE